MLVKFIVPVIDTESGKYEFNGELSAEAYDNMVMEKFYRTNNQMNAYVHNYGSYGSGLNRGYGRDIVDERVIEDNTQYQFFESTAVLSDSNDDELDIQDLYQLVESGKKFILKVNINPNEIDEDAESEIRYWMDDSDMVLTDSSLDQKTCLLSLPKHEFLIDCAVNEDDNAPIFRILGCKIVQIYRNNGQPFHFGMIVEKIERQ